MLPEVVRQIEIAISARSIHEKQPSNKADKTVHLRVKREHKPATNKQKKKSRS